MSSLLRRVGETVDKQRTGSAGDSAGQWMGSGSLLISSTGTAARWRQQQQKQHLCT